MNKIIRKINKAMKVAKSLLLNLLKPKCWLLIAIWLPLPKIAGILLGIIAACIVLKAVYLLTKGIKNSNALYAFSLTLSIFLKMTIGFLGMNMVSVFIGIIFALYYSMFSFTVMETSVEFIDTLVASQITSGSVYNEIK